MKLTNVLLGKLATLMIIFASFYYPIGAFFIIQMGVPSTPVNIGFRALAAGTALFLIMCFLLNPNKHLKISKSLWLLLAWWTFYGGRILFDLSRGVKFGEYGNETIYGITYGNILIPIFAIVLWKDYIDLAFFKKWAFLFILFSAVLVLIVIVKQAAQLNMDLFLQRLDLVNNKGKARESSVLNPIAIGFYGELLFVLSFFRILYTKVNLQFVLNVAGMLIGFLLLLFGASRGPFLSGFLVVLVILFSRFKISNSKVVLFVKYATYILLISVTMKFTLLKNVSMKDFYMFNRITKFVDDRQANRKEARDINIESAWQDFLDSPLVGKQFVGTLDNFYPHNAVVEVFMATGLVGACMFFPLILLVIGKTFNYLRSGNQDLIFLVILFTPCFLALFTSGSLFQAVEYWLLFTLVFVAVDSIKNKSIKTSPI